MFGVRYGDVIGASSPDRHPVRRSCAILDDRLLRQSKIIANKSDTLWNVNLNVPARSMKGVMMLFEDAAIAGNFTRDTPAFSNPKIMKVRLPSWGFLTNSTRKAGADQQWNEERKSFLPAENDITKPGRSQ